MGCKKGERASICSLGYILKKDDQDKFNASVHEDLKDTRTEY
jgi:hypothetical protein